MRVTCVALGLLALLAVACAADVEEPAELAHKSKHSNKKHSGSYDDPDGGDSPPGDYPGFNRPYDHIHEHSGNCRGSRDVSAAFANNNCFKGSLALVNPPQDTGCPNPQFCGEGPANDYPTNDCTCQLGEWYRFGATQVEAHYKNQPGPFPMVDVRRQSFECVDARGENPMLGTPGGDLAEAMAAAMSILKLTSTLPGTTEGQAIIDQVFSIFANRIASAERPLYFHSDDGSMRRLFASLKDPTRLGSGISPPITPSIFPWRGPTPQSGTVAQAWLKGLKDPNFNGCGHVRLQLRTESTADYSVVKGDSSVAVRACSSPTPVPVDGGNCISAKLIAERMIENYFNFWWWTPDNSKQRRKIAFAVEGLLQGPLLGKAVTIIAKDDKDVCPGYYPVVRPTFAASQVFVYHAEAITDFRGYATRKFFADILEELNIAPAVFKKTWDDITGVQLTATLTDLTPANRLGIFTATVPISPIKKGDHGYGKHHHHHTSGHHYYSDSHDYSGETNYDDSY